MAKVVATADVVEKAVDAGFTKSGVNNLLIGMRSDLKHKHPDTSAACRTLSTTMHAYCRQPGCDCTCHETGHVSWKSSQTWERPHKD